MILNIMRKSWPLAAMLALLTAGDMLADNGLKVQPDKENLLATHLEGEWKLESTLSKKLTGRDQFQTRFAFKSDLAVAAKIPTKYEELFAGEKPKDIERRKALKLPLKGPDDAAEKYEAFWQGTRIYMAGVMTRDGVEYPFVLAIHSGNPLLVYFRPRNNVPLGDSESFKLFVVPAKEKANDLLFIGGDSNEPFSAYERVR